MGGLAALARQILLARDPEKKNINRQVIKRRAARRTVRPQLGCQSIIQAFEVFEAFGPPSRFERLPCSKYLLRLSPSRIRIALRQKPSREFQSPPGFQFLQSPTCSPGPAFWRRFGYCVRDSHDAPSNPAFHA